MPSSDITGHCLINESRGKKKPKIFIKVNFYSAIYYKWTSRETNFILWNSCHPRQVSLNY